jgi:NAD(P)-dependent dehydrogenase (short-subunit alcohol dehydrogenase family)
MSKRQNERAVAVTGAFTGIGKAVALALDASGGRAGRIEDLDQ